MRKIFKWDRDVEEFFLEGRPIVEVAWDGSWRTRWTVRDTRRPPVRRYVMTKCGRIVFYERSILMSDWQSVISVARGDENSIFTSDGRWTLFRRRGESDAGRKRQNDHVCLSVVGRTMATQYTTLVSGLTVKSRSETKQWTESVELINDRQVLYTIVFIHSL